VRMLEENRVSWISSPLLLRGAVVLFIVTTGLLATADQQQAGIDAKAAAELNTWAKMDGTTRPHYFPGAILSGLGFYLDRNLWTPAQPGQEIEKGAVVVVPWRSLPPRFDPRVENPQGLKQWVYEIPIPLRTLDSKSYAGFYGTIWGPLPFSFSREP